METRRLRQFCAIAELGSLTKAAALLGLTHSALSKAMKVFQDEIGKPLLQAEGRGLILTKEGLHVYGLAKDVFAAEERLLGTFEKKTTENLRIGATEVFLPILSEGIQERPLSEGALSLLDLEPGQIEYQVKTGELDYGITYAPSPTEGVEIVQVGSFSSGCYHHRSAFKNTPVNELPFIVPATRISSNPLNIRERDGWPEELLARRKSFHVNLLSTGLSLVENGLGAIYIPHFLGKMINGGPRGEILRERALPAKFRILTQNVYVIHHRNQTEDASFKRICSILRTALR